MDRYTKFVLTIIAAALMGLLVMRVSETKPVQARAAVVVGLGVSGDGNSCWILRDGQPEHWAWHNDDQQLYRHDHEHGHDMDHH
jgi:hypothetical protein